LFLIVSISAFSYYGAKRTADAQIEDSMPMLAKQGGEIVSNKLSQLRGIMQSLALNHDALTADADNLETTLLEAERA
jgi:hypothetical protein